MCAQIHTQHEVDVAARVYSASVQQACAAGTASVGMTATVPINLKISHIKKKANMRSFQWRIARMNGYSAASGSRFLLICAFTLANPLCRSSLLQRAAYGFETWSSIWGLALNSL